MLKTKQKNILSEIAGDLLNKPCRPTKNRDVIEAASNAAINHEYDKAREIWSELDSSCASEVEIKGASGPVHK